MKVMITSLDQNLQYARDIFGEDVISRPFLGDTVDKLKAGDLVIGTLPINAAAKITSTGADYWHLIIPGGTRGRTWHLNELREFASFIRFTTIQEETRP